MTGPRFARSAVAAIWTFVRLDLISRQKEPAGWPQRDSPFLPSWFGSAVTEFMRIGRKRFERFPIGRVVVNGRREGTNDCRDGSHLSYRRASVAVGLRRGERGLLRGARCAR